MTYLDIHPLFKTMSMENMIARSKHIPLAVVDINFVVTNDTI